MCGDRLAAAVGLEDDLGERDVLRDPREEVLLALDEFPVVVLAEIPRRQDVLVGVVGQSVGDRLAVGRLTGRVRSSAESSGVDIRLPPGSGGNVFLSS